jgi:hypothetical protein
MNTYLNRGCWSNHGRSIEEGRDAEGAPLLQYVSTLLPNLWDLLTGGMRGEGMGLEGGEGSGLEIG